MILRMFGYHGDFSSVRCVEGQDNFENKMLDTNFYIKISEIETKKLIEAINKQFSPSKDDPKVQKNIKDVQQKLNLKTFPRNK